MGCANNLSHDFSPWSCSGRPMKEAIISISPLTQAADVSTGKATRVACGDEVSVKGFARLAILCAGLASNPVNLFFAVSRTYPAHPPSVQVWVVCSASTD